MISSLDSIPVIDNEISTLVQGQERTFLHQYMI